MLKWMLFLSLLILVVGAIFLLLSLTVETPTQKLELETPVCKERFEMSREEVKLLKFTFPSNVTIITKIGANMCVGLKIYTGEAFEELFGRVEELNVEGVSTIITLMNNISKPISWSHREYYKHVIQNNETSTYYFLVYNYPSCYPKTVNLEIGYVIGSIEEPKEERATFKNQMLSAGLAATAVGFLTLMYGLAKEPKK